MGNCVEGLAPGGRGGRQPKPRVELRYFPISGRAEAIRLALLLGDFDYTDKRVGGDEWKGLKTQTPYGQLPVLVLDPRGQQPTTLAQTKAILRYVGKLATFDGRPLYPTDPLVAAKVDEVLDAFDDLWILLAPTYRLNDRTLRESERRRLFGEGGEGSRLVAIFEQRLAESGLRQGRFVVPEAGLSVADLTCFCMLNTLRSGFVEGLDPAIFDKYASVVKHREMMAGIEPIWRYYEDEKRSNPCDIKKHYEVFRK